MAKYEMVDTIALYADERYELDEQNDCAVRAIASVYGIGYLAAHQWCRSALSREDRKGTWTATGMAEGFMAGAPCVREFTPQFTGSNRGWRNYTDILSKCTEVDISYHDHLSSIVDIRPKGVKILTLSRFMKDVAKDGERYLVTMLGHALAVVDRVVYDNTPPMGGCRDRSRILMVWKLQ